MTDNAPSMQQVWLGLNSTSSDDGYLPIIGSVSTLATATFSPKISYGDYQKDADDYISTLIFSDFSGGMNVEDMNEGSDTNRCWTAFADIRKPGKIAHNSRVEKISPPAGASGTAYTCGQILNTPYVIWSSGKVYGRKESDGTWYSGVDFSLTPVGKPVAYQNKLFVPCGSSGYAIISEADSVANPGVPTVTNVTTGVIPYPAAYDKDAPDVNPPTAIAFRVFDQKLWALTTGGALVWSFTGADDTWSWVTQYDESRAWYPRVQSGETPKRIIPFPNPEGITKLYVTTDRGAYIYEQSAPPSLQSTPIQVPPHPDNGGAVAVWRPGEDLLIGNGLDLIRYTSAGVIVPLSGLARDDGLPQELWGRFTDLEPETSELLGLVGPIASGGSGVTYTLKFGTNGSGNTNLNNPGQIARDSSGNIYVVDTANARLKKHQADGTYVTSITSLTGITGVCLDISDNVYVTYRPVNPTLAKYNSSLSLQWSTGTGFTTGVDHTATDGTYIYTIQNNGVIKKHQCSDGTLTATLLSGVTPLAGNPRGIATDGTYLYVTNTSGSNVYKFTLTGTTVTSWGSSGTGDGQFQTPYAIAVNPVNGNIFVTDTGRDDIQEFTNSGSFVRRFSTLGSGDGQINDPTGIVVAADGLNVYVADQGNDRVTKFTYSTALSGQTYPGLYSWSGIGWMGRWKGDTAGVNPNWLHVTATDRAYRAYWGMSDGYCYSTKLARFFENPRRALIAGEREFEPTMEIVTSKFDAAMLGNWKLASHMVVFLEHGSSSEYITIEYLTDADGGWQSLGTVNTTQKTYLPFGLDALTGFSAGLKFNWVQFRIRGFSTESIYKCPLIKSIVFCFLKIPQNTDAFTFVVAFPNEGYMGRSANEIRAALNTLVDAKEMVKLRLHEWDGDEREYRGYLTSVSGEDAASELAGGSRACNFIALRDSE